MVASCTWEKRPSITQPLKSSAGEVRGGWGRLGEVPPLPFTDLHRPPPTFGAVAASIPMAKPSRLHPARRRGIPVALTSRARAYTTRDARSEEHTSELQSHSDLVCRLLLEKKNT